MRAEQLARQLEDVAGRVGNSTVNHLVASTAFERNDRARRYPALVAAGKIGAEAAQTDFAVWWLIARAVADDRQPTALLADVPYGPSWADVRHSLDNALTNRQAACTARPDDESLRARLNCVAAMQLRFGGAADHFTRPRAEALKLAA